MSFDALMLVFNGFPEPLCAIHKITYAFRDLIDDDISNIQDIIKNLEDNYLTIDPAVPFFSPTLFTNVNPPDDLIMLENHANFQ